MNNDTVRENPEPFNCFVEITDPFAKVVTIKAGRQQLSYGDQRVVSTGNWSNTTTWLWDAAKVSLKYKKNFIDAWYGQTEIHNGDQLSILHKEGYDSFGFYGHLQVEALFKELGLEPFAMTKDNEKNGSVSTRVRTSAKYDVLKIVFYAPDFTERTYMDSILTRLISRRRGLFTDEIDAYAYHGLIGYPQFVDMKPCVSVEYSYASGDGDCTDGKHKTIVYGFYGKTPFGKMSSWHGRTWRTTRPISASSP
jgi:hypothetical protein